MKVLIITRSNLYRSPGGDTIQIDMTSKYLRLAGISVDICFADSSPLYHNYDLIHFFNIIRPDDILPHIRHDIPFVVSSIFVDYAEYEKINRKGFAGMAFNILSQGQIEYAKAIARHFKNGDKIKSRYYLLNGHKAAVRYIASRAKLLLPNSDSEYERLSEYIDIRLPYKKVVNAIDSSIFDLNVEPDERFKDHVLCVGRIEGRKNQLNLIRALMGSNVQLTIIGKPSPNHIKYYEDCKRLGDSVKNIRFVNHISHYELVKIYKAARVHVLPSWFETTGLSSLEAGVMECNVVVTKKGDTEEYFNDMAFYCEPDDVSSIRNAVLEAFYAPINKSLRSFILENYTWQQAAKQTAEAYNSIKKHPLLVPHNIVIT